MPIRVWSFLGVSTVVVLALIAYLVVQKSDQRAAEAAGAAAEASQRRLDASDVLAVPHLVVRNTAAGPSRGDVALIPLDALDGPRAVVDVSCERVAAVAAGGICLQAQQGVVSGYQAVFLGPDLEPDHEVELGGLPSRVRVSADGTWAASTAFVNGHAYTDAGFSTETTVYEASSGDVLGNLEDWTTTRAGAVVDAVDRNFWGVSFVGDGPEFFATMGTGGSTFLLRGDVSTRSMVVVAENGACPSVSPDGATVVYKQVDLSTGDSRMVARDVATGEVTLMAETRPVDDQVTWLNEDTVLYTLPQGLSSITDFDVWSAPVDGGAPVRVVTDAAFPTVSRP